MSDVEKEASRAAGIAWGGTNGLIQEKEMEIWLAFLGSTFLWGDDTRSHDDISNFINGLGDDDKKKLSSLALEWAKRSRKNADAMADAQASLAIVASLVFGFCVTSYVSTSSDWYDIAISGNEDANSETNHKKRIATAYAVVLSLACMLSAWGLPVHGNCPLLVAKAPLCNKANESRKICFK